MRASAALVAFAAAAVSAQQNYTSELDMKIDPNSVEIQTRAQWCQAQTNTCNLLCNKDTDKNSCAQEDLQYECTCASNSSMPGLQYYTQTLPTFICETLFGQCNVQNAGNADGQKACKTNIKDLCGKNDPPKAPVADSSSSASGSASPTASGSASATGTKGSTTSTSTGLAAPTMAPVGNGAAAVAAVGLLAYFL
ncbi:chromatin structure-remodeling complex protein RSC7 [Purpureocillium lavendulum]|uniref:Chromatin structure-remodeling complex protein RSC7 n=1 Tax=Purpureocillium lavendulum TaxID=1247861 RepID=A0AB34G476_9HYPO|nr:chromatin structure-remodeling complex protein RSC7 [Purpureocillium lavendulum]